MCAPIDWNQPSCLQMMVFVAYCRRRYLEETVYCARRHWRSVLLGIATLLVWQTSSVRWSPPCGESVRNHLPPQSAASARSSG